MGKTVRFKYVSAFLVFISLVVTVGYTPSVSAAAPLGKTLGGLADKTVPALTKAVTDTTAPITNAVSPALTTTVSSVVTPVSTTVVPVAVNTVEQVATPVVNTVGNVTGPAVPAVINTVDNVAAPITNTALPAAVGAVDTAVTPVTTTVGGIVAPVVAPVTNPTGIVTTPAPIITPPRPVAPAIQTTRLASAPLAFVTSLPTLQTGIAGSHSSAAASQTANTYGGLPGFVKDFFRFLSGVLPPFAWELGNSDVSYVVALWLKVLALVLIFIVAIAFRGLYRKLRDAQKNVFLVSDELMFNTTLSPGVIKVSAFLGTSIVIAAIVVISAILTGT